MKYIAPVISIFLFMFFLSFIKGDNQNQSKIMRTNSFLALDTLVNITVYDINKLEFENVSQRIEAVLLEIDNTFSAHNKDSELHYINNYFLNKSRALSTSTKKLKISESMYKLVKTAFALQDKTQACFNPFLLPLSKAWNIKNGGVSKELSSRAPLPEEMSIQTALALSKPGDSRVWIQNASSRNAPSRNAPSQSASSQSVSTNKKFDNKKFDNENSDNENSDNENYKKRYFIHLSSDHQLDLGGLAKGLAIDQSAQTIEKCGYSGLVNIGGDLKCTGLPANEDVWKIGVRSFDGKGLCRIIETPACAIATSGDYERYFEKDGKKYHHIFDSKTGYPARGISSVTVGAFQAVEADAAATAAFAAGPVKCVKTAFAANALWILAITEKGEFIGPVINEKAYTKASEKASEKAFDKDSEKMNKLKPVFMVPKLEKNSKKARANESG